MKYIIKFKKQGKIRFISHLDLQKVFLRLFRIIDVKPKYSNGFNPHPKLSFALPLSLGFASEAEYLELETESEASFNIEDVKSRLLEYLPDGLTISYIQPKPENINKKLASYIDSAGYLVLCPYFENGEKYIKKYLSQEEITYEKTSRKSGKTKMVNIKPSIHELKIVSIDNNIISLSTLLHAGSDSVLNPNVLIQNLFEYMDMQIDINELSVTRKNVFCNVNGRILNVDHIVGI